MTQKREAYMIGARVKDLKTYKCSRCREDVTMSMDVEAEKQKLLLAGYSPSIICQKCAGGKR